MAKTIADVDSNFKVETAIHKEDIVFYDILNAPFAIHGVYHEEGKFRRLPEAVAKATNEGVHFLHANTAGGRVRFRTDSPYVAIHVQMPYVGKMPHFALTGAAGFDMYAKEGNEQTYIGTFQPPFDIEDGYESIIECGERRLREFTVNFPLYSDVASVYVGLAGDATVLTPTPYTHETPIVYYGSSITQGGCASRPGSSYQSMIARRLDSDYINLGFSGSARGEDTIMQYISGLNMAVFVYDYDHNAPDIPHLESTHERGFLTIREAHPTLPIVLMSRPKAHLSDDEKQRLAIVRRTYENARAREDKNVYFIAGTELAALCGNEGTVDGCHPTDFGFASMAKALGDVLEEIIG